MSTHRSICLTLILMLGLLASAASGAGPRERLSFKNTGLYGGWNEYFVSEDCPFDFLIVQASIVDGKMYAGEKARTEPAEWNAWLKRARAQGKRVIADLAAHVIDEKGEIRSLHEQFGNDNPIPVERFNANYDAFFAAVDEEELYAITIGEEHVFWGGQQERLEASYAYLKSKFDVPVYQWYSPSTPGSTPGHTWPNLPTDGWLADEYIIQRPNIETHMRVHTLMQKPIFQIIWAAPDMPSFQFSERTFWDQYEVCRKYDVPVAFFCWTGRNDTPHSDSWGWQPHASAEMKRVFENFCLYGARLARTLPPVPQSEWELNPVGQVQVKLAADEKRPGYATYGETFAKPREVAAWTDASMSGFANLAWDSSPIQLKPRSAGQAKSALRYCFVSPGKPTRIAARVEGKTVAPGSTVEVHLADLSGKPLANVAMKDGAAELQYDGATLDDTRFVVTVVLQGAAAQAGDVVAEISGISIEVQQSE